MAALVKQSLADQIYMQLREDIIDQKIAWGEKLNVNELQEGFGISSTPIREAINRLQKEGLVEYKNNIGARVIELTEKDIIEIQEVALTLDCAAIKYAMETEKYDEIAEELLIYIEKYKKTSNEEEQTHCVEEFTNVFYKYANNTRLSTLVELVRGQQGMLRSTYRKKNKDTSNMEEHIKIYQAVMDKDVNAAVNAMEENYKRGTDTLIKIVN